jgi:hypothetical protein
MKPDANLYESLYNDKSLHYGSAKHNRCPGVRYLPRYEHWLMGGVIDLGCGNGDTVRALRAKGIPAAGVDWIEQPENEHYLYGGFDITTSDFVLEQFKTSICLDVFEHINDEDLIGLISNMKKTQRQVITTFTGSHVVNGVELHINQKSPGQWQEFITNNALKIHQTEELDHPHRRLFLCSSD